MSHHLRGNHPHPHINYHSGLLTGHPGSMLASNPTSVINLSSHGSPITFEAFQ